MFFKVINTVKCKRGITATAKTLILTLNVEKSISCFWLCQNFELNFEQLNSKGFPTALKKRAYF
jgi:hypothetical protein